MENRKSRGQTKNYINIFKLITVYLGEILNQNEFLKVSQCFFLYSVKYKHTLIINKAEV